MIASHSRLLIFCLLMLTAWPALAEVRIQVRGIDGNLRENVINHLGTPPSSDDPVVRRFARRAPELAQEGLQALGYYEADISVRTSKDDDRWTIRLDIEPGQPVRISEVNVVIAGEAANDPSFIALGERLPLSQGDVLHHGRYETAKRSIENLGLARGYFDGRYVESRIAIRRQRREAEITLHYDSSRRYSMGEVVYPDLPLSDDLLRRLVPFRPGDPYGSEQISRLNRNLMNSAYFKSVRVRPQQARAGEDLRVPVVADVEMEPRNRVGVGAGFATDVGPRVRLNWRQPWVNEQGHSLDAATEISEIRQSFTAQYNMPLDPPLEQQLQFFGGLQFENIEDTRSDRATAGVQRQRILTSGWRQTISLRWQREDFTQAGQSGSSTLTLPGTSVERTRSRGGLDANWGDRQFASIEFTHPELGSDQRLARLRLTSRWLRSVGRHRGTLRAEYGALSREDFANTPPSLRFFAGGDQSIRGFSYQSLGPKDDQGRLIGGSYLIVASAEYSYEVIPNWRGATFIDAGNAFSTMSLDEGFARGAGVGVRWQSPIGPVRLDFAWGVSEPGTPFRFHFSLGPEL